MRSHTVGFVISEINSTFFKDKKIISKGNILEIHIHINKLNTDKVTYKFPNEISTPFYSLIVLITVELP